MPWTPKRLDKQPCTPPSGVWPACTIHCTCAHMCTKAAWVLWGKMQNQEPGEWHQKKIYVILYPKIFSWRVSKNLIRPELYFSEGSNPGKNKIVSFYSLSVSLKSYHSWGSHLMDVKLARMAGMVSLTTGSWSPDEVFSLIPGSAHLKISYYLFTIQKCIKKVGGMRYDNSFFYWTKWHVAQKM